MDWLTSLAPLGGMVGFGGFLLALFTAYINRKERHQNVEAKKAEVENTLSSGSLEWARELRAENVELRAVIDRLEEKLALEHKDARRRDRLIEEHARWDRIVVQRLSQAGINDIPDPPVLQSEGED